LLKIIAEATANAYRGATIDIQQKIRRVVEVWRQRQIFQPGVQQEVEAKIDGSYMHLLRQSPANL
jgi:regulator of Ty1 transposition protein 103